MVPLLTLSLATAVACHFGFVDARGVGVVAVLMATAVWASLAQNRSSARTVLIIVAIACLALAVRRWPGFEPVILLENIRTAPDAQPMRITAHFDVGVAAFVFALFFCRRVASWQELRTVIRTALPIAAVTAVVVIGAAWGLGYVRPDLKWPDYAPLHLVKVLLWVCVLEEAFFRGVVQDRLTTWPWLAGKPGAKWMVVGISALLFGAAHLPGGWTYAALATAAGVGYSLAYDRTRRIEAPILAHFAVNAIHFIAFSYPHLERSRP